MRKTIRRDVLAILQNLSVEGNNVRITEQLDRKLYEGVRDVLVALGGPWNKKAKAHVFESDPTAALDATISAGSFVSPKDVEKMFGFVPTPPALADKLVKAADVKPGHSVLEPSAGTGHLLAALHRALNAKHSGRLVAVELQHDKVVGLKTHPMAPDVVEGDFLTFRPSQPFNRIIANFPFLAGADARHALHAWECLAPGGKMAAICSGGVTFRERNADKQLRELMAQHGTMEELGSDAFESEGVTVHTVLICLTKPGAEEW